MQEAEILAVELDPEGSPLEMLKPALAKEAVPVLSDPAADRPVAQVATGLLTHDPLELAGLFLPFGKEAQRRGRLMSIHGLGATQRHRDLQAILAHCL